MRTPRWAWGLVAFFFFAGLALTLWEETGWIGIGQIWMGVAVLLAIIYLGVPGKIGEKLGSKVPRAIRLESGGTGAGGDPGATASAASAGDTAAQLERLERLHQRGELSAEEYQLLRERILSP